MRVTQRALSVEVERLSRCLFPLVCETIFEETAAQE
jgi:hypothetical protein